MPLAWVQVHSVVAHEDSNGCCRARAGTDLDPVLGERKLDAVAAIVDAELQLFDLWRHCWVESEHLPAARIPVRQRNTRSTVPAIAPKWIPSAVVPP